MTLTQSDDRVSPRFGHREGCAAVRIDTGVTRSIPNPHTEIDTQHCRSEYRTQSGPKELRTLRDAPRPSTAGHLRTVASVQTSSLIPERLAGSIPASRPLFQTDDPCMSSQTPPKRPWYCADALTDDYLDVGRAGEDLQMIKTIKAIQSLVANIGVIVLGSIGILYASGNATWIVVSGIITLGLLNGVLAVDYAAVAQALVELSDVQAPDSESNSDSQNDDS